MQRRGLLARLGLAAAVGLLGGCTERTLKEAEAHPPPIDERYSDAEIDLPVRDKFEIAEEEMLRAAGDALADLDEFRAALEERDLAVESVEETERRGKRLLELTYAPPDAADRGFMYDLGVVAGGYAALVEGGSETDELDATVRTAAGVAYGEFRIDAEWAAAYLDGELTAAEYAETVADTAESKA